MSGGVPTEFSADEFNSFLEYSFYDTPIWVYERVMYHLQECTPSQMDLFEKNSEWVRALLEYHYDLLGDAQLQIENALNDLSARVEQLKIRELDDQ